MNNVTVTKYRLYPESIYIGTQYSYGVEQIQFSFDESWNGLDKFIMFNIPNSDPILLPINIGNSVIIPREVTQLNGFNGYIVFGKMVGEQIVSVKGTLIVSNTLEPPTSLPTFDYVKTTETFVPYIRENNGIFQYSLDGIIWKEISVSGIIDYNLTENKPQINNIELIGNKSNIDLNLASNDDLNIEIENRTNKDLLLDNKIIDNTNLITNIRTDLTKETNDRIAKDTDLQNQIDVIDTNIGTIETNLSEEIQNRINSDNNLQNEIDLLKGQNEWIGSIQTVVVGQEQTVLTQFVIDTAGRQPRKGDEVTILDRNEIWMYSSEGIWFKFVSSGGSIIDASKTNKGVVQIGNGINVNAGLISTDKSTIGLENVDNVKQYSASNPPPYPVTSVNGQTGIVSLNVPTKTSELTNDSNFVNSSVTNAIQQNVTKLTATIINYSLLSTNWNSDTKSYTYTNPIFTATSIVEIVPLNNSIEYVKSSEIYPNIDVNDGNIIIYCKTVPTNNINIKIVVRGM